MTSGLYPGELEGVKQTVHRGMQWGAGLCALYNGAAWLVRKDRHLLTNAMLYALLWAVEREHVKHHSR